MNKLAWKSIALLSALWTTAASADVDSIAGHISDVNINNVQLLVKIDSGLPDNCATTLDGYILVDQSLMQQLILGIWLRGDAAQTLVTIKTTPAIPPAPPPFNAPGVPYCRAVQFDPEN